jgi:hypothetical protein
MIQRAKFFRSGMLVPAAALAFSLAVLGQAAAQTGPSSQDLSGVWLGDGAGNNRALLLQPAMPLMQPWVKAKFNEKGIPTDPDPFLESCDPLGVPRVLLTNTPVKIVQTPAESVFLYERNHDFREVYTDGREHPKDVDSSWWGHSIGRWDGATFVVDTVGSNDKTWVDWSGLPHTMRLDITVDDPKAYTQSFTAKRMFKLKPWDIGEDICNRSDEQHFRQGIVQPATTPGKK